FDMLGLRIRGGGENVDGDGWCCVDMRKMWWEIRGMMVVGCVIRVEKEGSLEWMEGIGGNCEVGMRRIWKFGVEV
ncbi:hypothetical protein, partial [Paenibacillus xylanexedens]|uniref:hypothetical protein n=1 Tax=Paenibacillus xylanexedens TaxID=528191 RepID=UPI001C930A2B